MKKKLYKEILVDIEVASIPTNQCILSGLCNNILVVVPDESLRKSKLYKFKTDAKTEPKQYFLEEYIGVQKNLKQYLYITRSLINVLRMNQTYNEIPCCFINEHTNDNIDVFAEYEVRSIEQIQKIKK